MLTHAQLIARIAVATGLGGIIGFERDLHSRHAGLRTHIIVAMAAATFMVVSAHFMFYQGYLDSTRHLDIDTSRIAASVVSGVGFIAGGTILRTGLTIQGLTTAAGLWLVTAIGLCAGAGMFIESFAVTAMGFITLSVLRLLEDRNAKWLRRSVSLVMDGGSSRMEQIMLLLKGIDARVYDFDYAKEFDGKQVSVSFDVTFPIAFGVARLIALLEQQNGMRQVRVRFHKDPHFI
jgi:putative Mg2+ transporter-C (MgtC) family protein